MTSWRSSSGCSLAWQADILQARSDEASQIRSTDQNQRRPMDPIDIHHLCVVLLREPPTRRSSKNIIARGVAWHDGEHVELRTEEVDQVVCRLPDDLVKELMPVTGVFLKWFPSAHAYVVCGDRVS